MTRRIWRLPILVFAAVLLVSTPAHANVMLPLVVTGWVVLIPALIPIVLIESVVLVRYGVGFGESIFAMSSANIVSTVAGIPLAMALDASLGISNTLYDEEKEITDWRVPAGGMLLLIPFFFLSWWIEAPVASFILGDIAPEIVNLGVRDGNMISYACLGLLVGGSLTALVCHFIQEAKNELDPANAGITAGEWLLPKMYADIDITEEGAPDVWIAHQKFVVIEGQSELEPGADEPMEQTGVGSKNVNPKTIAR
jgi:hypothetical protein